MAKKLTKKDKAYKEMRKVSKEYIKAQKKLKKANDKWLSTH